MIVGVTELLEEDTATFVVLDTEIVGWVIVLLIVGLVKLPDNVNFPSDTV